MRSANRSALAIALGVLLMALPQAGPAQAGEADPQTRAAMHEIFEALRRVLPLSLNDGRFRDPAHRDEILVALTALSNGASQLEVHGRDLDASFSFLSRALARDARDDRGQ